MEKLLSTVNDTVLVGIVCVTRVYQFKRTMSQGVPKYLSCSNIKCRKALRSFYHTILLLTLLTYPCSAHTWEGPGCHRVGHTRTVNIPDCVVFNITLNACRGFCKSFAIPSPSQTLRANNKHLITSRAECCSIKEAHDVKVEVTCIGGPRDVFFKSAKSCSCSICRE